MEVKLLNDNLWYPTDKIFINGQWKDCHSKKRLPLENPSNGEVIAEISDSCDIDIDEAVNSASKALDNSWGDLTASESCLLYTSPSPRDLSTSRMPSSA